MAREIKYFNGSGGGTIYTVPAGRTAKVILNYVDTSGSGSLVIAGLTAIPAGRRLGGTNPITSTSTSVVSPGENQSVVFLSGGGTPEIGTTIWYIGAGATVSVPAFSAVYNFLVIEEF